MTKQLHNRIMPDYQVIHVKMVNDKDIICQIKTKQRFPEISKVCAPLYLALVYGADHKPIPQFSPLFIQPKLEINMIQQKLLTVELDPSHVVAWAPVENKLARLYAISVEYAETRVQPQINKAIDTSLAYYLTNENIVELFQHMSLDTLPTTEVN